MGTECVTFLAVVEGYFDIAVFFAHAGEELVGTVEVEGDEAAGVLASLVDLDELEVGELIDIGLFVDSDNEPKQLLPHSLFYLQFFTESNRPHLALKRELRNGCLLRVIVQNDFVGACRNQSYNV